VTSLRARLLLSASLVLVTFLGLCSVLLDRAFRESAMNAVDDRLRGRVFMLIGAADFDAPPKRGLIATLPDPSLSVPGSGNYARIISSSRGTNWESPSLLGIKLGEVTIGEAGEWRLEATQTTAGERLFVLIYTIIWEGAGDKVPQKFAIAAYENEAIYLATVSEFRRSLWLWFAGLSIALLVVQALNLNWGLRPLRRVDDEVREIEAGVREKIQGSYPRELSSLTSNLNRLIRHNDDSLRRYRNALGDLAHSIKTPLAILRNELTSPSNQHQTALEQIERIDRTVEYHLQRAAAAGRALMAPPLAVAPAASRIVESLRKVYAERQLAYTIDIPRDVVFHGDEGDLLEMIGNLADNASKWAQTGVRIVARSPLPEQGEGRRGLVIDIIDDGPGIPSDRLEAVLQRGGRLDQSVAGHGIGLAIVRDLVEDIYRGRLSFESQASGTRARIEFEPS
jgi:two-component system, OmpR family, sensor histidine kinase PhoQ